MKYKLKQDVKIKHLANHNAYCLDNNGINLSVSKYHYKKISNGVYESDIGCFLYIIPDEYFEPVNTWKIWMFFDDNNNCQSITHENVTFNDYNKAKEFCNQKNESGRRYMYYPKLIQE